jgi:multiple antibiotic resistance protein
LPEFKLKKINLQILATEFIFIKRAISKTKNFYFMFAVTSLWTKFLLSFVPLFVAIDVLGILPIFISLTEGVSDKQRKKLAVESTLTALVVAVIFALAGRPIFTFLGITITDFRIGGGVILLVLAVTDLLFSTEERKRKETSIGVVPIGIPLIIGPAALTTILLLVDTYGIFLTMFSIFINLILVLIVFANSSYVIKILGNSGSRAFAKVASLFLAAIAVMMIRVGLVEILSNN